MASTLATRKPVYKLTRDDFAAFPIWEWAINEEGLEGQDESFVRPTPLTAIPKGAFAQYGVAAQAKLRSGATFPAWAEVMVKGNKVSIQPTSVFLHDRHLDMVGMETTRLLSRLTQEVDNYPVSWVLSVPFDGEPKPRRGRVHRGLLLQLLALLRRLGFARQLGSA